MSDPGTDHPVRKTIGGLLLTLGDTSPFRTRRGTVRGQVTAAPPPSRVGKPVFTIPGSTPLPGRRLASDDGELENPTYHSTPLLHASPWSVGIEDLSELTESPTATPITYTNATHMSPKHSVKRESVAYSDISLLKGPEVPPVHISSAGIVSPSESEALSERVLRWQDSMKMPSDSSSDRVQATRLTETRSSKDLYLPGNRRQTHTGCRGDAGLAVLPAAARKYPNRQPEIYRDALAAHVARVACAVAIAVAAHAAHCCDSQRANESPKERTKERTHRHIKREDLQFSKPTERPDKGPKRGRGESAPPPGGFLSHKLGKKGQKVPKQGETSSESSHSHRHHYRDDDEDPSSPSSSSSSDGSSSSSSSSSSTSRNETPEERKVRKEKEKKHRRRRRRRKAMQALRLPMPTYNGAADYDVFESWISKWDSWCRSSGLKGSSIIDTMRYALLGKAGAWYTRHVAMEFKAWKVEEVYQQLYETCFPISFREDLRNKLMSATQHGRPVKDFAKDLENLAIRYDDVDPLTIRRIFWDGVDDFVRLYWIDKGLSLEFTEIQTLVYYAYRVEKREYERKRMERRRTTRSVETRIPRSGSSWSRRATTAAPGANGSARRGAASERRPQNAVRTAASRPTGNGDQQRKGSSLRKRHTVGGKLDAKQMAEHRAQGLCFTCHEPGHESRSCPSRQDDDRVHTRAAAVAPVESRQKTEKAYKPRVKRQLRTLPSAAVRVMLVSPVHNDVDVALHQPSHDPPVLAAAARRVYDEQLVVVALAALCDYFSPYTAWAKHYPSSDQRFAVVTNGHPLAPDVPPGYVGIYDRAFQWELLVPVDSFGPDGLDVASIVLDRAGIDELARQRLIRVDFKPYGAPVGGHALTWIGDRFWAVTSLSVAIEAGLDDGERFLIQTDGARYVVYDQAFGFAFQVAISDLYEGLTVSDVYRKPMIFGWEGELWPPFCSSTRIYSSAYWTRSGYHTQSDYERDAKWKAYICSTRSCPVVPKLNPRTVEEWDDLRRLGELGFDFTPLGAPFDWSDVVEGLSSYGPSVAGDADDEEERLPLQPSIMAGPATSNDDDAVSELARVMDAVRRACEALDSYNEEDAEVVVPAEGLDTSEVVVLPNDETAPAHTSPPRYSALSNARSTAPVPLAGRNVEDRGQESSGYSDLPELLSVSDSSRSSPSAGPVTPVDEVPAFRITVRGARSLSSSSGRTSDSMPSSFLARARRPYQYASVDGVLETRVERTQRVSQEERATRPARGLRRTIGESALVDSGSLTDFMSTTLADQLKVRCKVKKTPLDLQLAIVGSRSKVNVECETDFEYQGIKERRTWDVANVDSYDIVLGTPFLWQHAVLIGLNPTRVLIGSLKAKPLEGKTMLVLKSAVARVATATIDDLREQLFKEASDLFKEAANTPLPPLRAINHEVPLKDTAKVYPYRPSRCAEALRPLWVKKKLDYLNTGRWRYSAGGTCCPLMIIPKPKTKGGEVKIRTVIDTRARNENTVKVAAPLPDIEEILRNVVKHEYRSLIDGKDAYEQIRVKPEHVPRTMFNTPDGTMESLVMQIGDCNAPATYQTLMNHIFAPFIGVFMDVYLDDIIVYSDSPEEHVEHLRAIFAVLRRECFFLNPSKMQLFAEELIILGHVIDRDGIKMDPNKVQSVLAWPTPTNKGLLMSFLGAVGFLANDCAGIRVPMGVLTGLVGTTKDVDYSSSEDEEGDDEKVPLSAPVFVGRAVLLSAAISLDETEGASDHEDLDNAPRRSSRLRGDKAPPRQKLRLRKPSAREKERMTKEQRTRAELGIAEDSSATEEESVPNNQEEEVDAPTAEPVDEDKQEKGQSHTRKGKSAPERDSEWRTERRFGPNSDAPGLATVISAFTPEIDLARDVTGRYNDDKFFVKIIQNPTQYKNFEVEGEEGHERVYMTSQEGAPRKLLCIPDIEVAGKRLRKVLIDQAHSVLAHLAANKTMLYLRQDVWWKNMVKDVTDFVTTCHTCKTTKDNTQKPYGLLRTLPVPVRPWQVIGVDFIGPLPESQARHGRYDRICTIIDLFTSMVHLVPVRTTYDAPDMAEVIFHSVYRLHGMPEAIGHARKLVPKYIGPFEILAEVEPGSAYKLDIPPDMVKRRIHPTFNANLLRKHVENDDARFPGRSWEQVTQITLGSGTREIAEIVGFKKGPEGPIFYCKWSDKHITEENLEKVRDLPAFADYCDAMGYDAQRKFGVNLAETRAKSAVVTTVAMATVGGLEPAQRSLRSQYSATAAARRQWKGLKGQSERTETTTKRTQLASVMSYTKPVHFDDFQFALCSSWANQIRRALIGSAEFPGPAPPSYHDFLAVNPSAITPERATEAMDAELASRQREREAIERRHAARMAQEQHERENDKLNIPVAALKIILDHDTNVARLHTQQIQATSRANQNAQRGWFHRRGRRGAGRRAYAPRPHRHAPPPPYNHRSRASPLAAVDTSSRVDEPMHVDTPTPAQPTAPILQALFGNPQALLGPVPSGSATPVNEYDYDFDMYDVVDFGEQQEGAAATGVPPSETGSVTAAVAGLGFGTDSLAMDGSAVTI
ncbi:hypothetical protein EXIGLDRAFT_752800 [Exidia glandulosa HHB12029]|uniref:Reverse transcriptase n=1 Tax=Exidia glandulosa HHB12029 TaxID=1314781 RepID=A0A165EAI4_EXIGL|nr:hypothetical protein EXIGLDRAFT_752800 [Exidia glandulosa HHB12029]